MLIREFIYRHDTDLLNGSHLKVKTKPERIIVQEMLFTHTIGEIQSLVDKFELLQNWSDVLNKHISKNDLFIILLVSIITTYCWLPEIASC